MDFSHHPLTWLMDGAPMRQESRLTAQGKLTVPAETVLALRKIYQFKREKLVHFINTVLESVRRNGAERLYTFDLDLSRVAGAVRLGRRRS